MCEVEELRKRIEQLERQVVELNQRTGPLQVIGPGLYPLTINEGVAPLTVGPVVELDSESQKALLDNLEELYEK